MLYFCRWTSISTKITVKHVLCKIVCCHDTHFDLIVWNITRYAWKKIHQTDENDLISKTTKHSKYKLKVQVYHLYKVSYGCCVKYGVEHGSSDCDSSWPFWWLSSCCYDGAIFSKTTRYWQDESHQTDSMYHNVRIWGCVANVFRMCWIWH